MGFILYALYEILKNISIEFVFKKITYAISVVLFEHHLF